MGDSAEIIAMMTNKVIVPVEEHTLFEFRQRNLSGFATVNSALRKFEPKIVFS
jgi:hypothetical protein